MNVSVKDDKTHTTVHWSLCSGCATSGFFYEFLAIAGELDARVPLVLETGHCSESDLAILPPRDAALMKKLQAVTDTRLQPGQISVMAGFAGDALGRFSVRPEYSIGRLMVENVVVPRTWLAGMSRVDEIWVPTDWQIEIFAKAGVDRSKIFIIPNSVDVGFFTPYYNQTDGFQTNFELPLDLNPSFLSLPQLSNLLSTDISFPSISSVVDAITPSLPTLSFPEMPSFTLPFSSVENVMSYFHTASIFESDVMSYWRQINLPAFTFPNFYGSKCDCVPENNDVSEFKFLSVFKWEERKGWRSLMRAYWSEFTCKEKVSLHLHTYLPGWASEAPPPQAIQEFAEATFHQGIECLPPVTINQKSITRNELRDMYSSHNAFVLPTRGEGFGLPIAEAMSMTLPVIVTKYSGPADFISVNNSYPVEVLGVDKDGFAIIDENSLRSQMRAAAMRSPRNQELGRAGRETMVKKFRSQVVVDAIVNRLKAIEEKITQRKENLTKTIAVPSQIQITQSQALQPSQDDTHPQPITATQVELK
eukprot:c12771_g1_i1.p1 GENE.c12771_g1_i1~~c12771_g1_i1.p1  ORF type:complete len:574 (-),score=135.92 c12771_g1_i1:10-1608(-)